MANGVLVTITADTARKILNPKVFDDIDTGEILPNERILSGDFFSKLNLPKNLTDREILDDSALSVEKMAKIKTRLKKYIDNILPEKIISQYEKYTKQSANLVSLQLSAAPPEKISSVQSDIRFLIKHYKEFAAEISTAKELLKIVEQKFESAKEKISQDLRKNFAKRLKTARKSAGLTQTELAEKTLTTLATIAGYEVGRREPGLLALVKISQALNKPLDWFLAL